MQAGLENIWQQAPLREIRPGERIVIISDLHMGDGGRNDDFAVNARLVQEALEHWYLPKGYTLILNGDTEELLRTRRERIRLAWPRMYRIFRDFRRDNRLVWLQGNHEIIAEQSPGPAPWDGEALRLERKGRSILVCHGHQAGIANSGRYNHLIGPALRIFANTLGIGNRSVAHHSERRIRIEERVYGFAREKGILAVIGHTHRPLFESMGKREFLEFRLENLCREHAGATGKEKERIRLLVQRLKEQLSGPAAKMPDPHRLADSVYGTTRIPCLFNPGCCIGKRGFTALEIRKGQIALVSWSDPGRNPVAGLPGDRTVSAGPESQRTLLRRESLDYLFSRMDLLG